MRLARFLGMQIGLAYMLFLYAPVILLPIFASDDATAVAFPLSGYTGKWFEVP